MLLVILFATISFHAFFGVALTGSETLLAPDFFGQINLPWGPDPLLDQQRAGEIAWGFGEAPTLFLAVVVAFQWFKRDEQETRRKDRQADRDGDAELKAYNEYLGQPAQRGRAPQLTRPFPDVGCSVGCPGNHLSTRLGKNAVMRIAVVQLGYDDDEPFGARVERVAALVADQAGHDLVVLPELWGATGFDYTRWAGEAQPLDGPWARAMSDAARAAGCVLHAGSFVERLPEPGADGNDLANTSLLLDAEAVPARGLPQDPPVRLRRRRAPAHGGRRRCRRRPRCPRAQADPFGSGCRRATTCASPSSTASRCEAGAEMFLVPAAWPAARVAHWTLLGRARAIENQCVVVQCNTAGTHAGYEMGGHSQVVTAER